MKTKLLIAVALLIGTSSFSQIITSVNSLPDSGDNLTYKTLTTITDNYELEGEGVTWDFTGMFGDVEQTEVYADASTGTNFDQFPETELLINLAGAEAYANRNTTNIEVVGISGGQLVEGLDLATAQIFSEPYVIRRAPIGYGDSYSGTTTFGFAVSIEDFGPLADIFEEFSPVEGATVDSIRMTFTISRTETVDSYGDVLLGDETIPALRLVQDDETEIGIELLISTDFLDYWLNISDLIPLDDLGVENVVVTNYIFLDENSKEHLLEVNVDGLSGVPSGRYNADFTNSIKEESTSKLAIYPNPVQDELMITGKSMNSVRVINQLGQEVKALQIAKNSISLSLEDLVPGIYIVNVVLNSGEIVSEKIVKE